MEYAVKRTAGTKLSELIVHTDAFGDAENAVG
jgi:hypothetical protein